MVRIACAVLAPMVAPVTARRGDTLIVALRPIVEGGSVLAVVNHARRQLRTVRAVPEGVLYGALLHLILDDVICPLTDVDAALLERLGQLVA